MARDIIDPPPADRTALDENGRPESRTSGPRDVYGEPKGPLPPHFEIRPKDEIEQRARGGGAPGTGPVREHVPERERGGFDGGMRTAETLLTTRGQRSAVQRRDLDGNRLPEDGDDER